MMTAVQVKNLRRQIYYLTGNQVTPEVLGRAMGLSEKRAARGVREWEQFGPSGPAGVALTYLAQGLNTKLPEHIHGRSDDDGGGDCEYVIRLRWPRFIMMIPERQIEQYFIAQWIDDPNALNSRRNMDDFIMRAKEYWQEAQVE